MFGLFSFSWDGKNLTPGQRALIKLVKGLIVTAIIAAAPIIAPALSGSTPVVWADVLRTAGAAAAVAVLLAIDKYATAQGDAPLGTLAGQAADALSAKFGLNEPVIEQGVDQALSEAETDPTAAAA